MRLRPLIFLAILGVGIALARAQKPDATAPLEPPGSPTTGNPEPGSDVAHAEKAPIPASSTVDPNPKLKGYDLDGGAGINVYVVPIEGTIELGLASFVERVINDAGPTDVIILKVKTFGGRVDAAVRIRDALLETDTITVAFVRRAISAGALISLACDTIIMSPEASIGAATPVTQDGNEMKAASEKVISYMRAEMGATADANNRRRDVAEAMVDPDIEIKGVSEKGKLLTLTTAQAVELKIAEDTARSFPDALARLNLKQSKQVVAEEDWGELLARFFTDPVVSSLLMTFGFLGLLIELYTPGVGIPGTIGVIALALFFFGQYAANLAGAEEAILLAIGFGLLALEVFVIPGFGAAGIAGIGCIAVALGMAMVELELPWDVSFELGYLQDALAVAVIRVALVLLVLVITSFALFKYAPRSRAGSWLVFKAEPLGEQGTAGLGAEAPGGSLKKTYDHLLGKKGTAKTVLRPSGVAVIAGERVHVITDGTFLDPGQALEVVEVDGHRVVVRKIDVDGPEEEEA